MTNVTSFVFLLVSLLCSVLPGFAQTHAGNLSGMNGPTFLALDTRAGTTWLYVSEHGEVNGTGGGRVLRFNLTTGATTPQVVANAGSGDGLFRSPDAILVDSATGDIFVSDRFLNRIQRLSVNQTTGVGTFVMKWGQDVTGAPDEMQGPLGLARDSAGAIYVTEHGDAATGTVGGRIVSKYTISGTTATRVWRITHSLSTPYGIVVNGSSLMVSDGYNARVQTWDLNGGFQSLFSLPAGVIPLGLSIDSSGALWVAQSSGDGTGSTQKIEKLTTSGASTGVSFGSLGSGNGQFILPFHAVLNSATNLLYVADYGNDRVQIFDMAAPAGDTTPPTVASFAPGAPSGSTVNFTLTFNESVTGVDAADISANVTGSAAATIGTITGTGATRTIPVTYSGSGTVSLTVAGGAGANIRDAANNLFAGGAGSTSSVFTIPTAGDTTAPSVASFALDIPNATLTTATMIVTFSEPVTGVDASDFQANTTLTATANITSVTPGANAAIYNVNFSYTGTSGSLQMAIKTSGTGIADLAGNPFVGAGPTATVAYSVNNTPPGDMDLPTVATFTAGTPSGSNVNFALTFSEAVTGVSAADFRVVTTGTAAGTVGTVTGSGASYTVPVSFTGTGTIQLIATGGATSNIRDAATHWYAAGTGSVGASASATVGGGGGGDTTPPTVSTFTIASNTASSVTFAITFSEAVTGVNAADFTAVKTGGGTATVGTVTGSGASYSIPVTFTGTGTVGLNLNASGTGIQDAASNAIVGGSTGPVYTIPAAGDTTPPTVSTFTIASNTASSVTFAITFSEAVTGVNAADFTAVKTGGGTATVGTVTGSGASYSIPVTFTGTGTVGLNLNASGTGIQDAASNAIVGGATGPVHTISGGDTTPPTVSTFTIASNTASSVTFAINFNEAVTGVNAADFTAVKTGGGTATVGTVTGSGASYSIPVTFTGTGTVGLNLNASGTGIQDGASNAIVGGSTGPVYTIPAAGSVPVVSNASVSGQVGSFIAPVTVSATNSPTSFSAPGLASYGLSISAGGVISGVPSAAAGNATVAVTASNAAGTSAAATITLNISAAPVVIPPVIIPPVITPPPATQSQTISFNSPVSSIFVNQATTLGATASSGLPITYTVLSGNATMNGAQITIRDTQPVRVLAAQVGNSSYAAATPVQVTLNAVKSSQTINFPSMSNQLTSNTVVGLTATSSASLPITYTLVSGPATLDGNILRLNGQPGTVVVRATQAGDGAYNPAVEVTRSFAVNPAVRVSNLSSRLRVTPGDGSRAVIAGFVIDGTDNTSVMVRAVGPGLAQFGINDALAAPRLQLFNSAGVVVAENNGWNSSADVSSTSTRVGAFALAPGSADSAVVASLPAGAYTAQVTSAGTGTVLIEVYDAATGAQLSTQQLVNISTRGFVDTGDGALIAGFVVSGSSSKRVLVRGIGPGLTPFGVPGALADPVVKVYANGTAEPIAVNDNWETATDISAAITAAGAFPLAAGSKDAALVLDLPPGQYSAVITGAANGTGAGLVEVYEIRNR